MAGEPKNVRPFTAPTPKPVRRPVQTNGKTPVPLRSVSGTKYYQYKTGVPLAPGQTLGYHNGAYYARTAPQRSVTPRPPVQQKAPVAQIPPLTPQQQAQQAVDQELAPLYQQQNSLSSQQAAQLQSLTQAIMQQLSGMVPQIGAAYDQGIGQTTNLANAAAASLKAANPNAADQTMLQDIGAPQSQQAQIGQQNSTVFNGGAALQQYTSGVLPDQELQAQKLAAMTTMAGMPGIEGLRAQQMLQADQAKTRDAIAQIAAQRPDLIQKWLDSYNTAQYHSDTLKQNALYHQAVLRQGQEKINLSANKQGWQQTYQKNLLYLKQQGMINAQQYQRASLALRQSSLNSTNAYRQVQIAMKQNGFKTVGNDKTGIYMVRPDGSKTLLIPPVSASQAASLKPIPSSVRQKLASELSGHKQGYWGSATDGSPVTRAQLVGAAKAANETLQQFLNDPKAQQAQGIGYVPALKDKSASDPEINQVYLDAIRKYGLTRQQAFDYVGKFFPGWKARNQKSFFPKGEAAQGVASNASYANPVSGGTFERVDQGVDYMATRPVAALGDGTVVSVSKGMAGGTGDIIKMRLDRPVTVNGRTYRYIYYSEESPLVRAGQRVKAGQAVMGSGGNEIGFLNNDMSFPPLVGGLGSGTQATQQGRDFLAFIHALGAKGGMV